MLKIIWMSDLHFTAQGEVQGHDPRKRLSAAIAHINEHHGSSDFCVLSGDLVNRGTEEDYSALKAELDEMQIPYLPLVGNHDDRAQLKSVFSLPQNCMLEDCMEDFVQYALSTAEGLILCLDSQNAGSDAGEFCEARAQWLRAKLKAAGDTPVFLFMHHPPMTLGLPMQDTENMKDGAAFLDLIAGYRNVRHLFIGHVHRPICGTVRGIPFATMRSVLYQAPAPQPEWDWAGFAPGREAPNFGVLTINNADVNLQYTQFCDYELGT